MDEIVRFVLVAEGEQIKVRVFSDVSDLKDHHPIGRYVKEVVTQMNSSMTEDTKKLILEEIRGTLDQHQMTGQP